MILTVEERLRNTQPWSRAAVDVELIRQKTLKKTARCKTAKKLCNNVKHEAKRRDDAKQD